MTNFHITKVSTPCL